MGARWEKGVRLQITKVEVLGKVTVTEIQFEMNKFIKAFFIVMIIHMCIILFFQRKFLLELFTLYKEDIPFFWNYEEQLKYVYIKKNNGKHIPGFVGRDLEKMDDLIVFVEQIQRRDTTSTTIAIPSELKSFLFLKTEKEVMMYWYSSDSTYAKIKISGRFGGNTYAPYNVLHDEPPNFK
jgi:hypothetical protein